MLKKQTVWLLTMLSLMIVLSVYYMLSPNGDDLAYINDGQPDSEKAATTAATEVGDVENTEDAEVDEITNLGQDELFATIRMEIQDDRSKEISRLTDVVASANANAEEKEEALNEIDVLENLDAKEAILEEQIVGATGYEDVLVRSDAEKVHVHVKVEELTETEVVNIMQMVRDEFGDGVKTEVNFQPTGK
ncbi:SpoIIIAH-like family protein [Oceanobacillus sp. FSL K6-2867]|uniref:SpoIIIAH-like family protein n=1 Tax=Oceanobacillus sp. FSL K6-2867 TaxID=2954748 RepID=UPI0030DC516F